MLDKFNNLGSIGTTPSTPPSKSLAPSSPGLSQNQREAAASVNLLFSWCLMPDVHDSEKYIAGAIGIFADYPPEVRAKLADPVSGSRLLSDKPSLTQLRHVLEDLMLPIYRASERPVPALPEPPIDRTARPTYAELQARCARDGLFIGKLDTKRATAAQTASFREQFNISDEAWNAIPDAK